MSSFTTPPSGKFEATLPQVVPVWWEDVSGCRACVLSTPGHRPGSASELASPGGHEAHAQGEEQHRCSGRWRDCRRGRWSGYQQLWPSLDWSQRESRNPLCEIQQMTSFLHSVPLILEYTVVNSPGVPLQVEVQRMHHKEMMSILRADTFVGGIKESYNFQTSQFCHIWKLLCWVLCLGVKKTCLFLTCLFVWCWWDLPQYAHTRSWICRLQQSSYWGLGQGNWWRRQGQE